MNDKEKNEWIKDKLKSEAPPQVLFIERCLDLMENRGRMAIVLPDGIFGNNQMGFIRQYLIEKSRLVAIIDVPKETFMPNTPTKTSILVLQKMDKNEIPEDYPVFMATAETCGHDRRGNQISSDDVSLIPAEFKKWAKANDFSFKG